MKVFNRKASYNYTFLEKIEVGIVLNGGEVKSIKAGHISLNEAFVRIDSHKEAWLVNSHIHPYEFGNIKGLDPLRSRKLLLHKKEILVLLKKMEGKNLALVPVSCYVHKGKIKLEIALAKGKKEWDKRETIKKQDLERDTQRVLKNFK